MPKHFWCPNWVKLITDDPVLCLSIDFIVNILSKLCRKNELLQSQTERLWRTLLFSQKSLMNFEDEFFKHRYNYFIPQILRNLTTIYDFLECWIAIWVAKADFCSNEAWQIGHIIFKVCVVVLWDEWCLFKVAFELNTFPQIEQSWKWIETIVIFW